MAKVDVTTYEDLSAGLKVLIDTETGEFSTLDTVEFLWARDEPKAVIGALGKIVEEYLQTLSDTVGEERYDSYRGFATEELGKFLSWLEGQQALWSDLT